MPVQFALPDLGENIESGDVIRILVDVGDRLAEDQTVIELETDKAVIEVPSSVDGTVTEILVQQGDTIAVGQPILAVETAAAPVAEEGTPSACTGSGTGPHPDATSGRPGCGRSPFRAYTYTYIYRRPRSSRAIDAPPSPRDRRRYCAGPRHGTGRTDLHRRRQGALKKATRSASHSPVRSHLATRLQPVGCCRASAHDQGARNHCRAPRAGLGHHPAGHPIRQGRPYQLGKVARGIRQKGRSSRRQADADRDPHQSARHRPQGLPAVQRQHRHGPAGSRVQTLFPHRHCRRYALTACSCRWCATWTKRTSSS